MALLLCSAAAAANPSVEPGHTRFSPFWTNIDDCITTIHLHNNVLKDPLTVNVVLYLEDGTPVSLPPVQLPPFGGHSIQVNETMRRLGYEPVHFGGAEFSYRRRTGGALSVETDVAMPANNLAYSIPSYDRLSWQSDTQHAVFWLPGPNAQILFALNNVTDEAVVVEPTLRIRGRSVAKPPITIRPRGFAKVRLSDLYPSTPASAKPDSRELVGSITLKHTGPLGALHTTGWIDDTQSGYSTMLSFTEPASLTGQELYGTQIFTGPQHNVPDVGKSLSIESCVVLKNLTAIPVRTTAEFFYTVSDSVASVSIPVRTIGPGQVVSIDFTDLKERHVFPAFVTEGSIRVQHYGSPGALMGRVFGVSEDRSYGFYSMLEEDGVGSRSGVHWSLEGDTNSIFTILNIADAEDGATLELAYNGGSYTLPPVRLAPMQAKTINLREIVARGPSRNGVGLPAGAIKGGFRMMSSNLVLGRLILREHLISSSRRTSTPFYSTCDYVDYLYFNPGGTVTVQVGQSVPVYPWCAWNFGNTPDDIGSVVSQA